MGLSFTCLLSFHSQVKLFLSEKSQPGKQLKETVPALHFIILSCNLLLIFTFHMCLTVGITIKTMAIVLKYL